jgi:hypothetical protein
MITRDDCSLARYIIALQYILSRRIAAESTRHRVPKQVMIQY